MGLPIRLLRMGCMVPFRWVADIDIYDQHGPHVLIQVIGSESSNARFREICNTTANATFVKNARLAAGLPEKHEAAGPVEKMLGCLIVPSWSFWKPANAESQLVAWLRQIASSRSAVLPVGFVASPIMAAAWCDPVLNAGNLPQDRLSHQMVVCTPRLWLSPGVDGHACLEPLDGNPTPSHPIAPSHPIVTSYMPDGSMGAQAQQHVSQDYVDYTPSSVAVSAQALCLAA